MLLQVSALKKTFDDMKNSSSEEALYLLGKYSISTKSGKFQILSCTNNKAGQLELARLEFFFTAAKVENDYLFVTYKDSEIKLKWSSSVLTLNVDVYRKVRQAIVDKLGSNLIYFKKIKTRNNE